MRIGNEAFPFSFYKNQNKFNDFLYGYNSNTYTYANPI